MVVKSGFLLLYKPKGISSAAVLGPIKRLLPKKTKVGHAGTLDPFASGLLIVGIGSTATKQLSRFMTLDKEYIATGKLGELTDTLDYTGTSVTRLETLVTQQQLIQALTSFGNGYIQTPPLYSALKCGGSPLYRLARKQLIDTQTLTEIALQKSKKVVLHSLELLSFEFPYFTIRAHVSHGTYIRSLIADIGARVGSCATTYELERRSIGAFKVEQATVLQNIVTSVHVEQSLFNS